MVFSEDELCEALPENAGCDDIKKALKTLSGGGYVDVKYSSGNMYCIAPLKIYEEETPEQPEPEPEPKPSEKRRLSQFFAAFAGGALGSFMVSLVFALIGYVG